ncbi:MAG: T9SS type A sorting domain-containing protein [Candidatus Cloacimonetes bacterium]|nr:T9SS type A sorting domain-containing protein [Candidatus Cloacimonadota bacterium]
MFKDNRLLFYKYVIMLLFVLVAAAVWGQVELENERLFRDLDRPVYDMFYSELPGIDTFVFALPGLDGGIAYYNSEYELEIYSLVVNLGAVSIAADEANQRILGAFGRNTYSDGLYEFDVSSHEFSLIYWYMNPQFIKKLDAGFYFSYGYGENGSLRFSEDGDNWTTVTAFYGLGVVDIEETNEGALFAASGNLICLENEGNWGSYEVPVMINDIYVKACPGVDEVYIACGDGTDSDAVYRVEYAEGEISGLTMINWFTEPYRLYEYEGQLVVGCLNDNGLFLVETEEMSEPEEIISGFDFTEVYCFDWFPSYMPNFVAGTDTGVYMFTNSVIGTAENDCQPVISLTNYPNPFNPETRIEFELEEDVEVELAVYNLKGQLVKRLLQGEISAGRHIEDWDGRNGHDGQSVGSGIYYCRLTTGGRLLAAKKMLLLQ